MSSVMVMDNRKETMNAHIQYLYFGYAQEFSDNNHERLYSELGSELNWKTSRTFSTPIGRYLTLVEKKKLNAINKKYNLEDLISNENIFNAWRQELVDFCNLAEAGSGFLPCKWSLWEDNSKYYLSVWANRIDLVSPMPITKYSNEPDPYSHYKKVALEKAVKNENFRVAEYFRSCLEQGI